MPVFPALCKGVMLEYPNIRMHNTTISIIAKIMINVSSNFYVGLISERRCNAQLFIGLERSQNADFK
jgi:hypothetical protein